MPPGTDYFFGRQQIFYDVLRESSKWESHRDTQCAGVSGTGCSDPRFSRQPVQRKATPGIGPHAQMHSLGFQDLKTEVKAIIQNYLGWEPKPCFCHLS